MTSISHSLPSKLEDVLKEPPESISQTSFEVSFTLEDVISEKLLQPAFNVLQDLNEDDLFEEDLDDHSSLPGNILKSFKNTIPQSFEKGANKSNQDVTTNSTQQQNLSSRKIRGSGDTMGNDVNSVFHEKLQKVNEVCRSNRLGLPSSLSVLRNGVLVIGTTLARVVVFEIGEDQPSMIMLGDDSYGAVTTVSISRDEVLIACGCNTGLVFLVDKTNKTVIKTIPPHTLHTPLLKLLFLGENYSHLLRNDTQGNVFIYTVEKLAWEVGVTTRRLISHNPTIIYHDIKAITLNKRQLICLCSHNLVICLLLSTDSFETEVVAKIEKPHDHKYKTLMANIEFGVVQVSTEIKTALFVSWGNEIQIYAYSPQTRNNRLPLWKSLSYSTPMKSQIYSFYQLTPSLLIVLDNRRTFRLLDIHEDSPQECVKSSSSVPRGVISQKVPSVNEMKAIKCFCNTLVKVTELRKDVYYISEDSIVRARLLTWTEYVGVLVEARSWEKLLRQSIEIHQRKITAFSDIPNIQKSQGIFEIIISKYLQEKYLEAENKSFEVIPEAIEYCLSIGLYRHLFKKIYGMFEAQGHTQLFIEHLEPFILEGMVEELPNQDLLEDIISRWADSKSHLLQRLFVQLSKSSLDYLLVFQLCRKYDLYVAMLYVSSINQDFVTPLNRVVEASQKNSLEENKEQHLDLIYEFIQKTVRCTTITGDKSLPEHSVRVGIPRLVLWLLVEENMEWLIDCNSAKYFTELEGLLNLQIVKYYMEAEFPDVDVVEELFRNCNILLERMRSEEINQKLPKCLLGVSGVWELGQQRGYYMLENYNPSMDHVEVVRFIEGNLEWLKGDGERWEKIKMRLPMEVQGMVLFLEGQYDSAFSVFQKHPESPLVGILFNRVSDSVLLEFLNDLAKVDYKITAESMFKLQKSAIPRHWRRIEDSYLRYQVMRYVVRRDKQNAIDWSIEDLLFYLKSLCRFRNESRVLFQLKKVRKEYPFFESFRPQAETIVRQHNLLQCEAFLSSPTDAFRIYKQLFQSTLDRNIQKLLTFQNNNARDLRNSFSNLIHSVETQPEVSGIPGVWFDVMSTVLSPLNKSSNSRKKTTIGDQIQSIYRQKDSHNTFLQVLMLIIQETLLIVSSHTTIEHMTQWMENNLKIIQLKFVMNCFCSTLKTYNQHSQNIQLSNEVIAKDMIQTFGKALGLKVGGVCVGRSCAACGGDLVEQQSVVFKCSHAYHQECCGGELLSGCRMCVEAALEPAKESWEPTLPKIRSQDLAKQSAGEVGDDAIYTLLSFEDIVHEEQQDLQRFRQVYEGYMILY